MTSANEDRLVSLEADVGNPGERWEQLKARVQSEGWKRFSEVVDDWLGLMWCLDRYRVESVIPRNLISDKGSEASQMGALNRSKGQWFPTLVSILLQNWTEQPIRPRTNVEGFSQMHQIDLAWPTGAEAPMLCVECKVTGGPAYGPTRSRSALADFSNRRKEIKFAATDLKLFRRQYETRIDHWGVWRESAPPKTFLLWAARLRTESSPDRLEKLIAEARALQSTYIEGVGLLPWRRKSGGEGYERIPLPPRDRGFEIDNVLHRIASEIERLKVSGDPGPVPLPRHERAVRPRELQPDAD